MDERNCVMYNNDYYNAMKAILLLHSRMNKGGLQ